MFACTLACACPRADLQWLCPAQVEGAIEPRERGAAFGGLHVVVGVTALPASALFGGLWYKLGAAAAFRTGAAPAGVGAVLLLRVPVDRVVDEPPPYRSTRCPGTPRNRCSAIVRFRAPRGPRRHDSDSLRAPRLVRGLLSRRA